MSLAECGHSLESCDLFHRPVYTALRLVGVQAVKVVKFQDGQHTEKAESDSRETGYKDMALSC